MRYGKPPLMVALSAQIEGLNPNGKPDASCALVFPVMPLSLVTPPAPSEVLVMPLVLVSQ